MGKEEVATTRVKLLDPYLNAKDLNCQIGKGGDYLMLIHIGEFLAKHEISYKLTEVTSFIYRLFVSSLDHQKALELIEINIDELTQTT